MGRLASLDCSSVSRRRRIPGHSEMNLHKIGVGMALHYPTVLPRCCGFDLLSVEFIMFLPRLLFFYPRLFFTFSKQGRVKTMISTDISVGIAFKYGEYGWVIAPRKQRQQHVDISMMLVYN